MLRNIVFDMGGVLLRWDPPYFIERLGITDPEDRTLLLNEIHHSVDWPLTDLGVLTEKELEERILPRIPERLREAAHQLIFHWSDQADPIPGMAELVRDCKQAGLKIYLLSNASRRQPEYWHTIPGSEYFDGTIVSAFIGCLKPTPEIYCHLLNTYNLKAEECLFVDDMAINAEGARAIGMDGFTFNGNADELRHYIAQQIPAVKKN